MYSAHFSNGNVRKRHDKPVFVKDWFAWKHLSKNPVTQYSITVVIRCIKCYILPSQLGIVLHNVQSDGHHHDERRSLSRGHNKSMLGTKTSRWNSRHVSRHKFKKYYDDELPHQSQCRIMCPDWSWLYYWAFLIYRHCTVVTLTLPLFTRRVTRARWHFHSYLADVHSVVFLYRFQMFATKF